VTDANGVPRSLPLSAIDVEEGLNPRTSSDEERQAQLVESVRRHGILQPLLVAPAGEGEGFRVVAGHRRLAAAAAVGLMEVPAIVREPRDGEAPALAVIENLLGTADRILVGEVRGPEALDMLQAMNTGHEGSLSTCHANSPADALRRLETMILMGDVDLPLDAVRAQLESALDLVVQVARTSSGARQVVEVAEVLGAGVPRAGDLRPSDPGPGALRPDAPGAGADRRLDDDD